MPLIPPPRRFNLGDLAIVVLASGVSCALARQSWHQGIPSNVAHSRPSLFSSAAMGDQTDDSATVHEIVGTGWVVASLTLIVLRLRPPRPRWRLLIRQPGLVAALATTIGVLGSVVSSWVHNRISMIRLERGNPRLFFMDQYRPTLCPESTAWAVVLAIVVAWGLLAASGRWRSERSWLDRAGRLLVLGWVGLLAARVYLDLRP